MGVTVASTRSGVTLRRSSTGRTLVASRTGVTLTSSRTGPPGPPGDGVIEVDWGIKREASGPPEMQLDPVGAFAAWEAGGGPAFWGITDGDRVGLDDRVDRTQSGVYLYTAGVGFTRTADADSTEKLHRRWVIGRTNRFHSDGTLVAGPVPWLSLAATFIALDPDDPIESAEWSADWFCDARQFDRLLSYTVDLASDVEAVSSQVSATAFVFNSSGSSGGNRFNSWSALMSALGSFDGPKAVVFEPNAATRAATGGLFDEVIPAGNWDLTGVTLLGNGVDWIAGGSVNVCLSGVTTLAGDELRIGAGLLVIGQLSGPLIAATTFAHLELSDGAAVFCLPGTAPIISASAGTVALLARGSNTGFIGSTLFGGLGLSGAPLVECSGSAVVAIDSRAANGYFDDGILTKASGALGVTVFHNVAAPSQDPARASIFTGAGSVNVTEVRRVDPRFIAYTPADSADWAGTDPVTVAEALDRLAAGFAAQHGAVP